jgi:transcriptional regulator with PAS, ATPase and Fis domain
MVMEHKAEVWSKEFPGAITVCDRKGKILFMNDRAVRTFDRDGGEKLIGSNVLDCHPGPARRKLEGLLATGSTNVYTIEKEGVRKLIYQAPWYEKGALKGLVELSLEIPEKMPHRKRA